MARPTLPFHRLDHLACAQHGLVERHQARALGFSDDRVQRQLDRGALTAVQAGVYRAAGARRTWEQAVLAACLAAGPHALASHRAAAVLWDLADPPAPVEIVVPYGRNARIPGTVVHRSTDLRPVDGARRLHIPVTNPLRTVGDLGAVAPGLVAAAVERGTFHRLFTTAGLWRLVDELHRPGRRGLGVLRRVLEARALGDARACSPLEPAFADIAARTGLQVVYQHPVVIDGRRYVLDFAVPPVRVGVEIDGLEAHASREALDRDDERQNRLTLAGWCLLRYTATHLVRRHAIGQELIRLVESRRRPGPSP